MSNDNNNKIIQERITTGRKIKTQYQNNVIATTKVIFRTYQYHKTI